MEMRYRKHHFLQPGNKITFIHLGSLGMKAILCSVNGVGPDPKHTEIRGSSLLLYFVSLFHGVCARNTNNYPDLYSILKYMD